ncbi:MAG: YHYH protein [Paracoccaceae bacterium]|nr:YHYH protein [Paracoccaceae bacterium]
MIKRIIPAAALSFLIIAILVYQTLDISAKPRLRYHEVTGVKPLSLLAATKSAGQSKARIGSSGTQRTLSGNGIPVHQVGAFPNPGNPNSIAAQTVTLRMPMQPKFAAQPRALSFGWNFGVSVEGVVFDPLAAEFWHGDPQSGWSYNALGGTIALGLDENYAHVQPTGSYHYHGIPFGLLELAGWSDETHSPLVGYAADGFPIYALNGIIDGALATARASYQLKSGQRPGGDQPGGAYDGTFLEDFEYVEGAGNLDQCNGAWTVSAEFPSGTYAYFLTHDYPVIPRCFKGTPDDSFRFAQR